MTAAHVLRRYLSKAAGDRGGHVIGVTRTGAPIYASTKGDSAEYHHLSPSDHAAAAMLHDKLASDAESIRESTHHSAMANSHRAVYDKAVARRNQLKPTQGHGTGNHKIEDKPTPEDGAEVGKVFTGRAVYTDRHPHHYEAMTAAEHGDASRVHGAAAEKARASGDFEMAGRHGAMRHAHVQAAISAAKTEPKDERRFGRRHEGRHYAR